MLMMRGLSKRVGSTRTAAAVAGLEDGGDNLERGAVDRWEIRFEVRKKSARRCACERWHVFI